MPSLQSPPTQCQVGDKIIFRNVVFQKLTKVTKCRFLTRKIWIIIMTTDRKINDDLNIIDDVTMIMRVKFNFLFITH